MLSFHVPKDRHPCHLAIITVIGSFALPSRKEFSHRCSFRNSGVVDGNRRPLHSPSSAGLNDPTIERENTKGPLTGSTFPAIAASSP
jgi:hypothetical protein